MPNGPKFKVLHEFVGSRGVACRIVTEDEKKPGMMRGESWDDKEQVWRQWLQSTEANFIYNAMVAEKAALAERDRERAEKEAIRAERDALKAAKG